MNKYFKEFEYISNGSDKLIIVCTGFFNTDSVSELIKANSYRSKDYMDAMQKYWNIFNYYQMKTNTDFDFLYLKDKFNDFVGYMFIDGENYILDDYAMELDQFITQFKYERENVTICGSSKGGFTSRLLGYKCDNIQNIVVGIPHLDLSAYDNEKHSKEAVDLLYQVLWSTEKKRTITEQIESYSRNVVDETKNEVIITGLTDFFIKQFNEFNNQHSKLYIYEEEAGHSEIITSNLQLFLNIIYSVAKQEVPNFGPYKRYSLEDLKQAINPETTD